MRVLIFGATGTVGQGVLREGFIQPMHGVRSRVWWYRAVYSATQPPETNCVRAGARARVASGERHRPGHHR